MSIIKHVTLQKNCCSWLSVRPSCDGTKQTTLSSSKFMMGFLLAVTRVRRLSGLTRRTVLLARSCSRENRLPARCISVAPTRQFRVKLHTGDYYKNLPTNPNLVKIGHLAWISKHVLLLPATINRHRSTLLKWNSIRPFVPLSVCMYVGLLACISAAPTGRIYGKLESAVKNPNLVKNRVQIRGNLTWRPKYISLLPATLNRHESALFEWSGNKATAQPWRYKYYANVPR